MQVFVVFALVSVLWALFGRFSAVLVFSALWFALSYVPMAHMVWGGGLLERYGALDFAGGTVVHINAGIAALMGAAMDIASHVERTYSS